MYVTTATPQLIEVKKADSGTTHIKFSPRSPSCGSTNLYRVSGYYVQSRLKNSEWLTVYKKMLKKDEYLKSVEEVAVESYLCEETRMCDYQVTVIYNCPTLGEVKSDVVSRWLDAIGT